MKHLVPWNDPNGRTYHFHPRTESTRISGMTCDVCNVFYDDSMEIQEFLSYSDTGGYSNNWVGDLNRWEIDICQYCLAQMLGNYVRVTKE